MPKNIKPRGFRLTAAGLLIAACLSAGPALAVTSGLSLAALAAPAPFSPASPAGVTWTLGSLQPTGQAVITPGAALTRPTLRLTGSGAALTVSGSTGCSPLTAQAALKGQALVVRGVQAGGSERCIDAALSLREQLGRTAERLPLVLTLHTTARIKNRHAGAGEPPEPQERAAAEEELLRATQAVIANTDTEARELVQLYGADPRRLHTVPPGVDAAVFHPDPERPTSPAPASQEPGSQTLASPESAPEDAAPSARETSEDPAPFRILFAGRPQPLKGPEILIRALPELIRRVPEARLEIRGSASPQYLTRLRALARDEGVLARCRFTPACPAPQLASAMRAADVVACPSSSETFGLVALEAQACGTPVAASDVGGLRTALEDGRAGLLVPERTPRAWARSLALLAEDPALRARLRARGLAHARTLTWDDAARRTAAVYAAVVGAR